MQGLSENTGWFPVVFRMEGERVLVVGGGNVAASKVQLLVSTGARVEVLSASLCSELERMVDKGAIHHFAQDTSVQDLQPRLSGCRLVYLATNDRDLNQTLATLCKAHNVPVCAVDDPAISTFITPALVTRGRCR